MALNSLISPLALNGLKGKPVPELFQLTWLFPGLPGNSSKPPYVRACLKGIRTMKKACKKLSKANEGHYEAIEGLMRPLGAL